MSIIQTVITFGQLTQQKINNLISSKNIINQNYNTDISKVQGDFNTNKIDNDEKNSKIEQLNISRINELNNVEQEINTLQNQINIASNNPYKNILSKNQTLNNLLDSSVKNVLSYKSQLSREKIIKISTNITKSIVPTITSRLTDQLISIASQNKKIEDLVDNVNTFIDNIKTQSDINKAKILRDSAINIINNNENRILSIRSIFTQLSEFLSIFTIIINTLSALPIPLGAPLGVGVPMNIVLKVAKSIESANKLVLGINTIIAICIPILSRMIGDLEAQKARLENINGLLDNAVVTQLTSDQLQIFLQTLTNSTTDLGEYKGFKFVLREEEDPKFIVEGHKRHYAVALDSQGVQVIQSEYSFTLNPDQLTSQLRLIIDSKNLQP